MTKPRKGLLSWLGLDKPEGTRPCPHCEAVIPEVANVCPTCHRILRFEGIEELRQTRQAPENRAA